MEVEWALDATQGRSIWGRSGWMTDGQIFSRQNPCAQAKLELEEHGRHHGRRAATLCSCRRGEGTSIVSGDARKDVDCLSRAYDDFVATGFGT